MAMTVPDFISMTQRIIARDGFEDYLPTLVLPERQHVTVLEGIPADVGVEQASRSWMGRTVNASEDFFLAFKVDDANFKVVARIAGVVYEQAAPAVAG